LTTYNRVLSVPPPATPQIAVPRYFGSETETKTAYD